MNKLLFSQKKELLGTILEISLPENKKQLINDCFDIAKKFENKYSRFKQNSELTNLNNNLNKWQKVDKELIDILKTAENIKKITKGYFNITIKDTLEKLGYKSNTENINSNNSKKCDIFPTKKIKINENTNEIFLKKQIDIGGIGKGYLIKKIVHYLDKKQISNYIINAGGDIFSKSKAIIKIEHPTNNNLIFAKTQIENESLCTSSPSRRKWGKNHHLINPKTNKNENTCKQITIIDKDPSIADALATGLFVAGFKKAVKIAKKHKIKCCIISNKDEIFLSSNLKLDILRKK